MDDFAYDSELLKETRLAQNISIESIAFDLCLTVRQMHSIENNLRDYFYSPAIRLVCIKKYAEKLGVDTDTVFYKQKKDILDIDKIDRELPNKLNEMTISKAMAINDLKISKDLQNTKPSNQSNHIIIELSGKYIENNLSNKISMSDLSKLTGYSERSIQLVYQKHLNQTPTEYIEEKRLLKAREMIETYKQYKKITEVAQEVGLVHLGRFSVNFRKRFGISPSVLARS